MATILYLTDKQGISSGYRPLFDMMLAGVGIARKDVMISHVYNVVPNAARKKGNMKAWTANPEQFDEVVAAVEQRIETIRPDLIVTSCPAVLAVFTEQDDNANTIEKTRGGVYLYNGIPAIVTYPVTALNRVGDKKGADEHDQYSVKSGAWILTQDWRKVARYHKGKERRTPPLTYSVIRSRDDADAAVRFLDSCVAIACDIETKSGGGYSRQRTYRTCDGFCGMDKRGRVRAFVFPFFDKFKPDVSHWADDSDFIYCWEAIGKIVSNGAIKIFQNGSYDNSYYIRDRQPPNNYLLDTIHMWHCLYPELQKSLDFISSILLDNYQYWKADIKGIDAKDETKADSTMGRYWRYNALDCYFTLFNALFMLPSFLGNEWARVNYTSEFMLSLSAFGMSMKGIKADKERLKEHELALLEKGDKAVERLKFIADEPDLNPNSPAQMKSLFYDLLGARPRSDDGKLIGPKSRKTPSVGARALKMVETEHPFFKIFVDAMHDAKRPFKQISGICRMGQNLQTDRFRYALSAAGTETWRLSGKSSNFWDGTNPQNITKKMRDWLVADENFVMFDIDYSQSDFYFVAYESQDSGMIKLTQSDKDTHAVHASHFFKKEYDWVVKGKKANDPIIVDPELGIRSLSKRVVHGSNFRMAAQTLFVTMGRDAVVAAGLALGLADCKGWTDQALVQICARLLSAYRGLYPRLSEREWYGEINELLAKNGAITNWYGMTRKFMGDAKNDRTQREATAFYGQSGTAMNMNRVLYELDHGFMPKKYRDGLNPHAGRKPIRIHDLPGCFMLLQVHDSFVGIQDTRYDCWQDNLNKILTVMERPLTIHGREFYVPAEAEVMARWSKDVLDWNPSKPPALNEIHAA